MKMVMVMYWMVELIVKVERLHLWRCELQVGSEVGSEVGSVVFD